MFSIYSTRLEKHNYNYNALENQIRTIYQKRFFTYRLFNKKLFVLKWKMYKSYTPKMFSIKNFVSIQICQKLFIFMLTMLYKTNLMYKIKSKLVEAPLAFKALYSKTVNILHKFSEKRKFYRTNVSTLNKWGNVLYKELTGLSAISVQ